MAITFRAIGATAVGSDGSIQIAAPAGLTDGDRMLALINAGSAAASNDFTPPAGWELLLSQDATSTGLRLYTKPAASEGVNWTWTYDVTGSVGVRGAVAAWYDSAGLATAGPPASASGTTSVACPSVISPGTGLLICVATVYRSGDTPLLAAPAGMTERLNYTISGYGIGLAELAVSSGATGSKTYANTSGNGAAGGSLVLWLPILSRHAISRPLQRPLPIHHLQ